MSDGPRTQGGEGPTTAGAKPSIAEVAAWLRRAAEQRDPVEDLAPARRGAGDGLAPVDTVGKQDGDAGDPDAPPGSTLVDDAGAEAAPEAPPADQVPPSVRAPVDEAPAQDQASVDAPPGGGDLADEAGPPAGRPTAAETATEPAADEQQAEQEPMPAATAEERGAAAPADQSDVAAGVDDELAAPAPHVVVADEVPAGLGSGSADSADSADSVVTDVTEEPAGPAQEPFVVDDAPADDERRFEASVLLQDETSGATTIAETHGAAARNGAANSEVIDLTDSGLGAGRFGAGEPGQPDEEVPRVEALVQDDLELAPDAEEHVEARGAEAAAEEDPAREQGRAAPAPPSAVSLFDLDLADLAARARAASERRGGRAPREPEPGGWPAAAPSATTEVDEVAPPEAEPDGHDLAWDDGRDQALVGGDVRLDREPDAEAQEAENAATPSATAMLAAVLERRRVKRKRYPRGQLTERIGVLRRVRAMLGVVVLTVVLGVAAGAAIGAFLVFAAFALRNAITSG